MHRQVLLLCPKGGKGVASARQFQFFFQLTAALGPNFSKTFKTANSTMTLLGDNLKEVRNKLKDVSAYQKQQTAVERSKQRVTDLEKNTKGYRRSMMQRAENPRNLKRN